MCADAKEMDSVGRTKGYWTGSQRNVRGRGISSRDLILFVANALLRKSREHTRLVAFSANRGCVLVDSSSRGCTCII